MQVESVIMQKESNTTHIAVSFEGTNEKRDALLIQLVGQKGHFFRRVGPRGIGGCFRRATGSCWQVKIFRSGERNGCRCIGLILKNRTGPSTVTLWLFLGRLGLALSPLESLEVRTVLDALIHVSKLVFGRQLIVVQTNTGGNVLPRFRNQGSYIDSFFTRFLDGHRVHLFLLIAKNCGER